MQTLDFNIVSTYSTIANVKPQTLLTNWFEHHLWISCWKLSVSLRRNHGNSHLFSSFHLQRRILSLLFLFKIISTLKQFINWLSAQSQSEAIFLAASSKKDVPVWTVSFLQTDWNEWSDRKCKKEIIWREVCYIQHGGKLQEKIPHFAIVFYQRGERKVVTIHSRTWWDLFRYAGKLENLTWSFTK